MTADELRFAISDLGLRQREFARLVGVTERAVGMWLSSEREIPGPLSAYVNLLINLPGALRSRELSRLFDKEARQMLEGMYRLEFMGRDGSGLGCVVLQGGKLYGSDSGVMYDGTYEATQTTGEALLRVSVSVPPGTPMVQGMTTDHRGFSYHVEQVVNLLSGEPVVVRTPVGGPNVGTVVVRFAKMRGLPN